MPARLKRLSAQELVKELSRLGFNAVSQRGSHVKLRRTSKQGHKQTLVVPAHGELDRGTLRAIARQASRYITGEEISNIFYQD